MVTTPIQKNLSEPAHRSVDLAQLDRDRGIQGQDLANADNILVINKKVLLRGEVEHCDTLTVFGTIYSPSVSSRALVIEHGGVFDGKAITTNATISGEFRGELEVSGHLFITETGLVTGDVVCATLEISTPGRIVGTIKQMPEAAGNPNKDHDQST